MKRLVLVLLLGAVAPVAAAGWCAYEVAFPALPCADGWAACRIGGVSVGGGTTRDAGGRPVPADARIGWFDLEPGPAFSPFVGLSSYGGTPSAAMATMLSPGTAPAPALGVPGSPPGELPGLRDPANPTANAYVPTGGPASATSPAGTPTVLSATGTQPVGMGVPSTGPVTVSTPVAVETPAAIATIAAPVTGCTDLVALEPQAMVGGLSGESVSCLEARIDGDAAQTTRDKLSRLLILNAEGKGNKAEWERLVKRHLEDIDRSDPDLCFKYALQLSKGGSGRSLGVIRWADTALENKHRWEGATYKKRVYDLHRLRAEAGGKLWAAAEAEYTTGEHTAENEAKSEKYRGMAKDYAREWLDYANASGQDTKNALALCVSASGNRSFCEGG